VILSGAQLASWVGHAAQDPYGEPLGILAEVLRDRQTGAPEWLLLVADGEKAGQLAPAARVAPTGRQLRVAATAAQVQGAPRVAVGSEIDLELKRRAAQHYRLRLDDTLSSSGRLREGSGAPHRTPPPRKGSEAIAPARRVEIATSLREAHAMEQASLKLLAAMRGRMADEELVHDVALHHRATSEHAQRVRARLAELDATPAKALDWLAEIAASAKAKLGSLRSESDPHDLRAAAEFEQREIDAYDRLERLALSADDHVTAGICRAIRADELAMLHTLRASSLWADPGARREQPSPFQAPRELAELAPRS
jgi:ferritin-like metal-binding protein YciE